MSKETFNYILSHIHVDLERKTVCEKPISPEERLAIALYRFGRGDYCYTIEQMTGRAVSTIRTICNEVAGLIITYLWDKHVRFPQTSEELKRAVNHMERMWQCTCAFAAVGGTHIPIKCPPGGAEAAKEYFNYKNFYSIILMGVVDARCRFLWANCGSPGSSHDATVFKASSRYQKLSNHGYLSQLANNRNKWYSSTTNYAGGGGGGDNAFPHHTWLLKPYSHAVLSELQSYFNYRLSRGRIVVECAFGRYKGRWRITHRRQECHPVVLTRIALACVVLHNICIDFIDNIAVDNELNVDAICNRTKWHEIDATNRDQLRDNLNMVSFENAQNTTKGAGIVRDAVANEFWRELNE